MIWLAYLGVAVAVVAYAIGLLFMDELASDIGNAAMLTAAVGAAEVASPPTPRISGPWTRPPAIAWEGCGSRPWASTG